MELLVQLILLPPLLVAAFNGMMGLFAPAYRKQETLLGALATLAVLIPFGVTAMLFVGMLGGAEPEIVRYFTWLEAGSLRVDFSYRIDQLSLLMTMIVTGVGALIHLYSIGYMKADPGFWRFFAYLNLFIFAMLNLVLAESLPVLFLGWEGVGLCSYLLIGYWYTDLKNSAAANKAFIVNRIGDFAFLLAVFIIFQTVVSAPGFTGTFGLDFTTLLSADTLALFQGSTGFWVCLLLFIGATGKSAQIPLFVWLPDAMAGPTPVSALIHAATMVTSGLYLLARLSALVLQAPGAMMIIAVIGALTAIMAASVAITQNDIKKVLAYSTVSQLGYMFLAAGVGAFFVAIFHVMTHAFFKACLFLGSGSVIHSMHHVEHELEHKGLIPSHHGGHDTPLDSEAEADPFKEQRSTRGHAILPYDGPFDAQDMRTMGGLKRFMPATRWTFLISTLAIAGIPPLSGFFSKDEILFRTFEYSQQAHIGYLALWAIGIATAILTAIYMTRAYLLTFEGDPRWPDALDTHPHESPWTMTVPLVVLAVLAAGAGFLGLPAVFGEHASWIHGWLVGHDGHLGPVADSLDPLWQSISPVEAERHASHAVEWGLLGLGTFIALLGVGLAWFGFRFGQRGPEADRSVRKMMGWLYTPASHKWNVDELYDATVVTPVVEGSRKGLAPFDKRGIDGAVMGFAHSIRSLSTKLRGVQTGVVQTYALGIVVGVVAVVALVLFL